ncbi:Anaphase-promoting complex subunit 5 [Holothuria leucospilota]|uniref:Anaphase-promoting complex subunit 5 n=1 Tax=Holothuria leucospilota TaxID=206669 RepID=A0A9Q1C5Y2_HOLLE|nr:Anaphase-promoting complex subunit 5 [Holothuria leucospilota]
MKTKMDGSKTKNSSQVQITPHKISILIVIQSFSERDKSQPPKPPGFGVETSKDVRWSVRERRQFAKAALSWVQGFDEDFASFSGKVQNISCFLSDLLNKRLADISNSEPLKLADFFESLTKLLDSRNGEAPLHRQSILGMFVRRMVLTYDKLTFSQTMKLYQSLKTYFNASVPSSVPSSAKVASPVSKDISGMDVSMEMDETPLMVEEFEKSQMSPTKTPVSKSSGLSPKLAEYFISEQAARLQNEDPTSLSPDQLQEQITALTDGSSHRAELHYLTFLNCLRLNEFCGAIHSLHKYFDQLTQKSTDSGSNSSSTEEWKHSYRYAALNLASLHYRLGHTNEAILALKEAIQKAQEANDHVCLQHAMSWMYRLQPDEEMDLNHSVSKSEEVNLPYLTSLGVQSLARQKALSFTKPHQVFEYLTRSDALNCQHQQQQLVCISLAQQSSLWNMYGYRFMSTLCDHLLVNSVVSEPSRSVTSQFPDTESFCLTLCNQARLHFNAGEFDIARDLINFAKETLSPLTKHSKIWMQCDQLFAFQLAVLHGKLHEAKKAVENLSAINQPESSYCECLLLTMQGKITEATESLNEFIQTCQKGGKNQDVELHSRSLLLLASIYLLQDEPIAAIPHLLECIALCQQRYQSYIKSLATAHIAYSQLLMEMPEKSIILLEQILPEVLANGSLYSQCCIQFLLVQCQCQVASKKKDHKSDFLKAAQLLNQVGEDFQRIGAEYKVKDVVYYQAYLYDHCGYTSERNKCALQFKKLDELYSSNTFPPMKMLWPLFL